MRNTIARCGTCDRMLNLPDAVGAISTRCVHCSQTTGVWLFPALHRQRTGTDAQHLLEEGHSSCMTHPNKKAVTVCEACGKFLCALCDIDWNGEHLCSACIEHQKNADTDHDMRSEYIHYDRVVFALAFGSVIVYFLGLILSPIALYIGWRYWKEPWRPVPYRKWGMIASLLLAFITLLGWGGFFIFFVISLST